MRAIAIAGMVAAVACASAGGSNVGTVGGGDQDANVKRVSIGDVTLQANGDAGTTNWTGVNASVANTWRYLPIAYRKLGLTITRYDSTQHIIEGERLHSHSPFGDRELTSLMDCGDVSGMPNASRFAINITARTRLKGDSATSSIASSVIASAKPDGVAGVFSPCSVNASAAERIAAAVADVAATGGR